MDVSAKVLGLADFRAQLLTLPAKLRKRALRNALAAGARVVRDTARLKAPTISSSHPAVLSGRRKPGTVRDAIVVRNSKRDTKMKDVGVFVNVRPAKKGRRGANAPTDPYYWRWLEFGWNPAGAATGGRVGSRGRKVRRRLNAARKPKILNGYRFLLAGVNALPEALKKFNSVIIPQIEKLNTGGQL